MKTLFYIDNSGSIEGKSAYHNITKKNSMNFLKLKEVYHINFFKFQLFALFLLI